jgi:transcription antitermination factor NusA-like protein
MVKVLGVFREYYRANDRERISFVIIVPDEAAALIIGKAGKCIKELRSFCDSEIEVSDKIIPGTQDRPVTIKADFRGTVKALERIASIVDSFALKKEMTPDQFEVPGYVAPKPR